MTAVAAESDRIKRLHQEYHQAGHSLRLKYCARCVMPGTRPRITFDDNGVCNACAHAEAKQQTIDWTERRGILEDLCRRHKATRGRFDCLVPCGGGKDGSTVAYRLRHELGMRPLCVTLHPQMPTPEGEANLERFIRSGYDHVRITTNPELERRIALYGFREQGRPRLPALLGQTTAVVNTAISMRIPLIFYGEDGEAEYGGVTSVGKKPEFSRADRIRYYFEQNDPSDVVNACGLSLDHLPWLTFPSEEAMGNVGIQLIHFSHFEDWDPYHHYLIAKKNCGFHAAWRRSLGTYTNFAQLDDHLQPLHTYLMYLKFGFGRASSDAAIDIRRGALDRRQAVALVRRYDAEFPEELVPLYLDYFGIDREEFDAIIDRFANKHLFEKVGGRWTARFRPE